MQVFQPLRERLKRVSLVRGWEVGRQRLTEALILTFPQNTAYVKGRNKAADELSFYANLLPNERG
jgi:hypothetical protein